MKKKIVFYLGWILLPLAVGGIAALLTAGNMALYTTIRQPPLAPPSILFPIVWTVLYFLMGISSGMVASADAGCHRLTKNGLLAYGISLVLNFSWSLVFFNGRMFWLAFLILIALWVTILITILQMRRVNKTAAVLQIPYLLWVTFAGYLNLAIALLNA